MPKSKDNSRNLMQIEAINVYNSLKWVNNNVQQIVVNSVSKLTFQPKPQISSRNNVQLIKTIKSISKQLGKKKKKYALYVCV